MTAPLAITLGDPAGIGPEVILGAWLRLRREGTRWVQTLKGAGRVEGGLHQREEREMQVPAPLLDHGALAAWGVNGVLADPEQRMRLQPVFTCDFKRTVRQTALRHKVYATFMAKPLADEPGSAMHLHQSVVDRRTGRNLFAQKSGADSALFRSHIAGLQRYLPAAMPLLAPNVNSYRRLLPWSDAPINVHWGLDNRTVGLRVPVSPPSSRRIENRLAGADANPYLCIAASLACGYVGMIEKMKPSKPIEGDAYKLAHTLPRTLYDALSRLNAAKPLRTVLGERFIRAVNAVKQSELNAYQRVISSWEREHLLLNV